MLLRHIKRFGHWGLAVFYLIVSGGLGFTGWYLQHIVFHPPAPPGQVFAAVFVLDPAAHVSLSAQIYPDAPWSDSLSLTVTDVPPRQSGWILVIQCPANRPYNTPAVPLSSYSTVLTLAQSASTLVGIYEGTGSTKSVNLDCVAAPGTTAGTSQSSPSLANVSVPALQLDQAMTADQTIPALYAAELPGGAVSQLVQVFPGVACPSVTQTSSGSGSATAPATPTPTSTGSDSAAASVSPSAAASPQASGASAAAAPSPSQQSAAPANPTCLGLASTSTNLIQYGIPGTETITETLNQVYPQGYQISMFPVGNTIGDRIIWNSAQSALDPDFNATHTAAESDANRDEFISGILFGILGGTAVASAEHVFEGLRDRKGKPAHRSIEL